MYFLSFSFEKEKERKYQRKEKKPIVFLLFLFYCGRRYLFARAVKYGARETMPCFCQAFWHGLLLLVYVAIFIPRLGLLVRVRRKVWRTRNDALLLSGVWARLNPSDSRRAFFVSQQHFSFKPVPA